MFRKSSLALGCFGGPTANARGADKAKPRAVASCKDLILSSRPLRVRAAGDRCPRTASPWARASSFALPSPEQQPTFFRGARDLAAGEPRSAPCPRRRLPRGGNPFRHPPPPPGGRPLGRPPPARHS